MRYKEATQFSYFASISLNPFLLIFFSLFGMSELLIRELTVVKDIFLNFNYFSQNQQQLCEQNSRCNRRQIEDLLVSPLQHLTKLPLLLKAIRKHSPQNDRNHHLLTSTIFDVEQSISECFLF